MALIECKFHSNVLQMASAMTVILPQEAYESGKLPSSNVKHKTLYLLHGYSDDHTIWLRRTSIERYATTYNIAVVMPAVHLSFYTDLAYGGKYWTFISEELPFIAQSLFPLSDRREDNTVAGLSMGGYGAMKLALRQPDRFAAAASLSGATDIETRARVKPGLYDQLFGSEQNPVPATEDLFRLATKASDERIVLPKLYQCCGTEDFLYEENIRFRDHLRQLGIQVRYEEGPGDHNWGYWDDRIQDVLQFFYDK